MDSSSTSDLRLIGARRVVEGRLTGASQAADCFPSPLIKLDVSISNIQLSDWFHRSTHASDPHHMVPCDGTEDFSLRTATQRDRKVISVTRCYRLIVNHRSVSSFTRTPEARVLPSTGITQHPRYRDPLRLPDRPSSYRGCWRCDLHRRRISPNYPDHLSYMPCSIPRRTDQVRVGFFPDRAAFPG